MINYLKHVGFIITSGLAALAGILILFILASLIAIGMGGALFMFSIGHGLVAIWKALEVEHNIYMKGKK